MPHTILSTLLFLVVTYSIYCLYQIIFSPLRHIPGPLAARFTRLWELRAVSKRDWHNVVLQLHDKYGPIVRVAPNRYSINDPSAVKILYGHGTKFVKSSYYAPFGHTDPNMKDLFSETNAQKHSVDRRKVASLYSMTTLVSYEAFVDKVNSELCNRLLDMAKGHVPFSVPKWMQFYAFDVIGEITVGESFGFLASGYDHSRILEAIEGMTTSSAHVGLFPEVMPIMASIVELFNIQIPHFRIKGYVENCVKARENGIQSSDRNDFLTKLLQLRSAGKINNDDIHVTIGSNVAAGSDTTAISLSSIIYNLLRNPSAAETLRKEIDDFAADGRISNPVTFNEAQKMPYLQAVIKEALRIHPVTDSPLWRQVPSGGEDIAGQHFPGNVSVGVSPWNIHFHEDIFGANPEQFRPERWLDENASSREQFMITFGSGSRTCIGKNISLLEMSKLVPQLVRNFDFHLVDPSKEWTVTSGWFTRTKFECTITAR